MLSDIRAHSALWQAEKEEHKSNEQSMWHSKCCHNYFTYIKTCLNTYNSPHSSKKCSARGCGSNIHIALSWFSSN